MLSKNTALPLGYTFKVYLVIYKLILVTFGILGILNEIEIIKLKNVMFILIKC